MKSYRPIHVYTVSQKGSQFLSNISAKNYQNRAILALVTAKNVGDPFLKQCVLPVFAFWSNSKQ